MTRDVSSTPSTKTLDFQFPSLEPFFGHAGLLPKVPIGQFRCQVIRKLSPRSCDFTQLMLASTYSYFFSLPFPLFIGLSDFFSHLDSSFCSFDCTPLRSNLYFLNFSLSSDSRFFSFPCLGFPRSRFALVVRTPKECRVFALIDLPSLSVFSCYFLSSSFFSCCERSYKVFDLGDQPSHSGPILFVSRPIDPSRSSLGQNRGLDAANRERDPKNPYLWVFATPSLFSLKFHAPSSV